MLEKSFMICKVMRMSSNKRSECCMRVIRTMDSLSDLICITMDRGSPGESHAVPHCVKARAILRLSQEFKRIRMKEDVINKLNHVFYFSSVIN